MSATQLILIRIGIFGPLVYGLIRVSDWSFVASAASP